MSKYTDYRLDLNVDGDFYSNGECLNCGLPEGEAADLLAPLHNDNCLTYFIKQPKTEEEIDRAIWACKVCCVSALRYSGKDKSILKKLGEEHCDYKIDSLGNIVASEREKLVEEPILIKSWWKFW